MSRARRTNRPARFSPITRRDALKFMGGGALAAFANPIEVLVRGLADGFVRQVMAESSGASVTPRNHVYIGLAGAPPRWLFDLPLSPYSSSETLPDNDGVVTRFNAGGGSTNSSSYSTASLTVGDTTLRMPHLWSLSIPICDSSGSITGTTPMTDLLANTAIIRGIRGAGDGHPFLASKQLKPLAGGPSLGGQVADSSKALLPAVMLTPSGTDPGTYYGSSAGTPLTASGYTSNPLNALLGGFNRGSSNPFSSSGSLYSRRQALDALMRGALEVIAQSVKEGHPGSDVLYASRSRAEATLAEGISGISSEYAALLTKYAALTKYYNSYSTRPLTGITDQYVGLDSTNPRAYRWNSLHGGYQVQGADLRSILGTDTSPSGLAIGFAVAEYLIKNGLSSSVAFFLFGTASAMLDPATTYAMSDAVTGGSSATRFFDSTITTTQQKSISYDEHLANGGGKHAGLILYSLQYLALSACIREFARSIGSTLWGETIVQVGSEFSRMPRDIGAGSEHAPLATVSSLFSGAIRKPFVVGNTAPDHRYDWRDTSRYSASHVAQSMQGHFGTGGLTTVNGVETHLVQGHLASTVATLLRVESPTPNNPSLLTEDSSGVVSALDEQAREVDE
jgi:hypothetical protein